MVSNICSILFTNSRLSFGKNCEPWLLRSFVAFLTLIPWELVIYSAPTKSSLKARNEASQIGIVCLSTGTSVLIPKAAWILAIMSR